MRIGNKLNASTRVLECDVAVIGGGMGGVAAALAAADVGACVVLSEAADRLGGQVTSQGVSALDGHPYLGFQWHQRVWVLREEPNQEVEE